MSKIPTLNVHFGKKCDSCGAEGVVEKTGLCVRCAGERAIAAIKPRGKKIQMKELTLATLERGAFVSRIDAALQEIALDIAENPDQKAARSVVVTMTVKPDKESDAITVEAGVQVKTPPAMAPALIGTVRRAGPVATIFVMQPDFAEVVEPVGQESGP